MLISSVLKREDLTFYVCNIMSKEQLLGKKSQLNGFGLLGFHPEFCKHNNWFLLSLAILL